MTQAGPLRLATTALTEATGRRLVQGRRGVGRLALQRWLVRAWKTTPKERQGQEDTAEGQNKTKAGGEGKAPGAAG